MQRKALDAHAHQLLHRGEDLLAGHAELGRAGLAHAGGADAQLSAGIVAQAELLRQAAVAGEEGNMGDVVEIDVNVEPAGVLVFFAGGFVGREHDLVAGEAAGFGKLQLGHGCAVYAAALLLKDLQNERVRAGLHRVVFSIARIPGKRAQQTAGGSTDAAFVVEVIGSRNFFGDFPELFNGGKRPLMHSVPLL